MPAFAPLVGAKRTWPSGRSEISELQREVEQLQRVPGVCPYLRGRSSRPLCHSFNRLYNGRGAGRFRAYLTPTARRPFGPPSGVNAMHAVTQAVEAWDYSQPFDNVASDDMRWMRDEVRHQKYRYDPVAGLGRVGARQAYWCEDPEGCAPKAKTRHRFKRKRPRVRGQFAFLACRLIVVATAFLARDHAAVAPLDRSGHRPAVSPWANGHAAWADADGGV